MQAAQQEWEDAGGRAERPSDHRVGPPCRKVGEDTWLVRLPPRAFRVYLSGPEPSQHRLGIRVLHRPVQREETPPQPAASLFGEPRHRINSLGSSGLCVSGVF
jgi:hypothetical protein